MKAKTLIACALASLAAHAHAGDWIYALLSMKDRISTAQIEDSDNLGMSLLLDVKAQPGRILVSGTSSRARAAGVQVGDELVMACSVVANERHARQLASLASVGTIPPAGSKFCAPVRTGLDLATVIAAFEAHSVYGQQLPGFWSPVDYVLRRSSREGHQTVRVSLPPHNLPPGVN